VRRVLSGALQQKLTHSLLSNQKLPETVETQMFIKCNERALKNRGKSGRSAMRAMMSVNGEEVNDSVEDTEDDIDSDTYRIAR
jgi:hypothetical protein